MFGDQEVIPFREVMETFSKMLNAIPRPKREKLFEDFARMEIGMRMMAAALSAIRGYFQGSMGEEAAQSPFVQAIDALLATQEKPADGETQG